MCELPEPELCEGVVLVVVVVGVDLVVVVAGVVVVTVAVGVVLVVVAGAQLAVTLVAPAGTPGICAGGVLGDALTVIVTAGPPSGGVNVTVQVSAEAAGIAATPMVTRTTPMVVMAIFSLRLTDTLVLSPPATT